MPCPSFSPPHWSRLPAVGGGPGASLPGSALQWRTICASCRPPGWTAEQRETFYSILFNLVSRKLFVYFIWPLESKYSTFLSPFVFGWTVCRDSLKYKKVCLLSFIFLCKKTMHCSGLARYVSWKGLCSTSRLMQHWGLDLNERWKCEAFENENQELRKASQQFSHLQM